MNHKNNHAVTEDRLNPVVFYGSVISIVAFSPLAMIFTDSAQATLSVVTSWLADTFGWYYTLVVLIISYS